VLREEDRGKRHVCVPPSADTGGAMDRDLELRRLLPKDLPAAMALSQSVGWNQVPADWLLFLELGEGYGLFAPEDGLVATVCLMPYPPSLAWISLLIVHQAWRRRGLGSALCSHALRAAAGHGLTPLLDATPQGRPMYLRMGFRDLWAFQRWVGTGPAGQEDEAATDVRPLEPGDLDAICALDAAAFGARRDAILARLAGRLPESGLVAARGYGLGGALLGRDGRTASQLGPLCACDENAALRLLAAAMSRVRGPLQVDVPDAQPSAAAFLRLRGCEPQRTFVRMILGDAAVPGQPQCYYALAGPELG